MRKAKLERFCPTGPFGSFGKLTFGAVSIYTVEQDWEDNAPFISRIPAGVYVCTPDSYKGRPAFRLRGETVEHFDGDEGKKRYGILIHVANTASELRGCIAPGITLGALGNTWAVLNSAQAMDQLVEWAGEESFELTITNFEE